MRQAIIQLSRVRADTDDLLAEVFAFQQPNQFAGSVLQSICDVFAALDPAVSQPRGRSFGLVGPARARSWQKYTAVGGDPPVWKRHTLGRRITPNYGYDIRIEMLPRAVFRKWQELKIKEVGASMVVVR